MDRYSCGIPCVKIAECLLTVHFFCDAKVIFEGHSFQLWIVLEGHSVVVEVEPKVVF